MGNQREPWTPAEQDGHAEAEAKDAELDAREVLLSERERVADARDVAADERERAERVRPRSQVDRCPEPGRRRGGTRAALVHLEDLGATVASNAPVRTAPLRRTCTQRR